MDRPAGDRAVRLVCEPGNARQERSERTGDVLLDDVGDVPAEHHLEAVVTDGPCHVFLPDRGEDRLERVEVEDRFSGWSRASGDDRGGSAVGEDR